MKKNKFMKKFALLTAAILMVQTPLMTYSSASAAVKPKDEINATHTLAPHESKNLGKYTLQNNQIGIRIKSISGGTLGFNIKNSSGKALDYINNVNTTGNYFLHTDKSNTVNLYVVNLESYNITVDLEIFFDA